MDTLYSGSLGPCVWLHFEMSKSVLKTDKVKDCTTKIQFAIWSRSSDCQLVMRLTSGSIAHTSELNPAKAAHCWDLQHNQMQSHGWLPGFFAQIRFVLWGQVCPTLTTNCLSDSTTYGGNSRLHGLLGFVIVQSSKDKFNFGDNGVPIVSNTKI